MDTQSHREMMPFTNSKTANAQCELFKRHLNKSRFLVSIDSFAESATISQLTANKRPDNMSLLRECYSNRICINFNLKAAFALGGRENKSSACCFQLNSLFMLWAVNSQKKGGNNSAADSSLAPHPKQLNLRLCSGRLEWCHKRKSFSIHVI